jgi:hypothetical protein
MTANNFEILAGVIHRIIKQQHTRAEDSVLTLRETLHETNHQLIRFVEFAENTLQKKGGNHSSSGGFETDHTLSKALAEANFAFPDDKAYLNTSRKLVQGLYEFVKNRSATSGEHVPIIFYRKHDTNYLLISLISLNDYLNINEDGELTDTSAIDQDAIKVGLRVDLDAMKAHFEQGKDAVTPYVRWIERRSARLPEYIQDFIPVGSKINDTKATTELIREFDRYLQETFADDETGKSQLRTDVLAMMRQKQKNDDHVHLEEEIDPLIENFLAVHGIEKTAFATWRQEQGIELNSSFKPEKSTLDRFEKFKITLPGSGITIQGNQEDLGRKVILVSQDDSFSLSVEIDAAEKEYLEGKYPSIRQS